MGPQYTWHDVKAALDRVENPLWDSYVIDPWLLQIECSAGCEPAVRDALQDTFGAAFYEDSIILQSTQEKPRSVAVEITSQVQLPIRKVVPRPLWSGLTVPSPSRNPGDPIVAAFYSYKGGVGRTTTAIAVASSMLGREPPARILLVDADIEAPGLTWLVGNSRTGISLVDAMAIVHEAEDWKTDALPVVAGLVRGNNVQLKLQTGARELLFLPAIRGIGQVFNPPVTFEQMVRARGRATIVGDFFIELGLALDVDVVLVDLRAGITEFASPLLLDSRVRSVLVTSCNPQSVDGTIETLSECRRRMPTGDTPDVVVTLVPPDAPDVAESISERIFEVLEIAGGSGEKQDDDIVSTSQSAGIHFVEFAQELIHYADLEDLVGSRLPGTDLAKRVIPELAERILRFPDGDAELPHQSVSPSEIAAVAKKLEFAESLDEPGLLPVPALLNLFRQPGGRLPVAVVLGAKGSGKTFAWGQMVLGATWAGFGKLLGQATTGVDAKVFPMLAPGNLEDVLRERVRSCEQRVAKREVVLSRNDLLRRLGRSEEQEPMSFWLESFAARLGLPAEAGESIHKLETAIREKIGERIVLILDGLEDAFQPGPGRPLKDEQRRLLRTLLVGVVNGLKELSQPYFGLIVFVRRDLAIDAIPQNFRQFEQLHTSYQLQWTPTEVLRLPVWMLHQNNWVMMPSGEDIEDASYETLRRALIPFWGEKMGGKSEAYTDRWVVAALSDLNGRIQARDVIRLVRFAAEETAAAGDQWPLKHRAIRDALPKCSTLKLEELELELPGLKDILTKLRNRGPQECTVPFEAAEVGLTDDETRFLDQHGLITRIGTDPRWYMPEMVRLGLRYRLEKRARPKILRMYRVAQHRRRSR